IDKPAPDNVTEETTRSAVPVLVTVTVRLLVLPTVTLPKFRLLGEALTEGLPGVGLCVGSETPVPPHPVSRNGSTHKDTSRNNCFVAKFRTFTCFFSQCRPKPPQTKARLWRSYPMRNGSVRLELLQAKSPLHPVRNTKCFPCNSSEQ